MYKKNPKEPIFWSGQLKPAWRGPVAGGRFFLRALAVTGSNPAMCVRFFLLVFGALGRKTQRRKTGALCAIAMANVVSLGVGRTSLFFFAIFPDAHFAVYGARRALRSKIWVSGTLHRQGPRMTFDARNVSFGIIGARKRLIPTLLPSETCAQTPLDRPSMLLRRDPDFAAMPCVGLVEGNGVVGG